MDCIYSILGNYVYIQLVFMWLSTSGTSWEAMLEEQLENNGEWNEWEWRISWEFKGETKEQKIKDQRRMCFVFSLKPAHIEIKTVIRNLVSRD